MALPHALEPSVPARLEWGHPRFPLQLPVALVDSLALLGAMAVIGKLHPSSVHTLSAVHAGVAFLLLRGVSVTGRINPRLSDDIGRLLGRLGVSTMIVIPLAPLVPGGPTEVGWIAPAAAIGVVLGRGLAYKGLRVERARGRVSERTLIIGAGKIAAEVATTLQQHPEYGLVPVGFLDTFDDTGLPLPVLGDVRDLKASVATLRIKRVIVAFGGNREEELIGVLRACDRLPAEVHVVPRFFELGVARHGPSTDDVWGIPLVRVHRPARRPANWRVKRSLDAILGSLALALSAPLMVCAALAVRLSSPGPVLFRQERVGQQGRLFQLLKFRTLLENGDSDTTWSVAEDDRRTLVGRFLRRTSIDELPQLINVLKGDMSLVGPRPERPCFVDRFSTEVERYEDRHRVPVGMTGWAQVHGLRGDTSIAERARFDNQYAENWSLWHDVVILARTIAAVFMSAGT